MGCYQDQPPNNRPLPRRLDPSNECSAASGGAWTSLPSRRRRPSKCLGTEHGPPRGAPARSTHKMPLLTTTELSKSTGARPIPEDLARCQIDRGRIRRHPPSGKPAPCRTASRQPRKTKYNPPPFDCQRANVPLPKLPRLLPPPLKARFLSQAHLNYIGLRHLGKPRETTTRQVFTTGDARVVPYSLSVGPSAGALRRYRPA
jgi:hypothetical protein